MAYPTPLPVRPKAPGAPMSGGYETEGKKGKMSWVKGLITLIIILAIIGGGIYCLATYTGIGKNLLGDSVSLKGDWQAVFLTNGQVYFGKVGRINRNFIDLKDIYYLQVITKKDTIAQPNDVQTQPEQQLTLIKLGNEIHGPKDEMIINRDQVVMMEDLKDDSRVVVAIKDYINSQKK